MSDKPTGQATVRMYDVGFGDCFLLSFDYKYGRDRHIMIDAGSRDSRPDRLEAAVTQLCSDCGGKLDAMVFTHRHQDHIRALGEPAIAPKLLDLNPDVVLLPWTEDPAAARDAKQPDPSYTDDDRQFLAELAAAQDFEDVLKDHAEDFRPYGYDAKMYNKPALDELLKLHERCRYVKAGDSGVLADVLPGVTCRVLGPPTLADYPELKVKIEEKYWKHYTSLAQVRAGLVPPRDLEELRGNTVDREDAPSTARWFINRLESHEADIGMRLTRALDGMPNNASLVLLFEVKKTKLLFPGDAEHKLWDFVLKTQSVRERLKYTRLYKVSHHGSGNGTPKAKFWEKLKKKTGDKDAPDRLVTLLSGSKEGGWKSIPASTFWTVIRGNSDMLSTYKKDKQSAPWVAPLP